MTYSIISILHNQDGFELYREEGRSHIKDAIAEAADSLCALTGHRWCHRLTAVWDWADRGTTSDAFVSIRDEDAYALSAEDDWEWLRNPEG